MSGCECLTKGVSDDGSGGYGNCRFWIIGNPTSGGGKGEKLISKLQSALAPVVGSMTEWTLSDLVSRGAAPPPLGSAAIIRSAAPRQGVDIARAVAQSFVHANSSSMSTESSRCSSDVVIAIGGDGTLSEVVNGLCMGTLAAVQLDMQDSVKLSRFLPRLVYLPSGTGTDFARLGYCCNSVNDVVSVVQAIVTCTAASCGHDAASVSHHARFESFRIDVGSVFFRKTGNRRFFINECSTGMSCDVIIRSDRYKNSWMRYLGGTIVFFAAAIIALIQLKPIAMRLRRLPSDTDASANPLAQSKSSSVQCPSGKDGRAVRLTPREIQADAEVVGQWVDFPSSTIAFGNGKYFGGGMMVCPHGDPTDQLFAVTAWYATFWPFVLRLYGVYSGSHAKWSSTTTLEGRRFEVDVAEGASEEQYCEMDGELGEALPAVVEFMGNIVMLRHATSNSAKNSGKN